MPRCTVSPNFSVELETKSAAKTGGLNLARVQNSQLHDTSHVVVAA